MFAAHLFLKQRGRSGIALAGFDNTVEAAYNRLTSYSFEIDSIARQILDWIVRRPQDSRLQPPVNEMRMRGKVMVRDG